VTTTEPLHVARRRLQNAVHSLADPVPLWLDGVCRWADPVYAQLRWALRDKPERRRVSVRRSVLPCRGDVLVLLIDIDATVAGWEPHAKTTLDRLRRLAARSFRPQDCAPNRRLLRGAAALGGGRHRAAHAGAPGVPAAALSALRRPVRLPAGQRW